VNFLALFSTDSNSALHFALPIADFSEQIFLLLLQFLRNLKPKTDERAQKKKKNEIVFYK
jgi:hypothetical protein